MQLICEQIAPEAAPCFFDRAVGLGGRLHRRRRARYVGERERWLRSAACQGTRGDGVVGMDNIKANILSILKSGSAFRYKTFVLQDARGGAVESGCRAGSRPTRGRNAPALSPTKRPENSAQLHLYFMKLLALLLNIIFDLLLLLRLVSQTFLAELLIEYSATASQDRVHVPDDARGL